MQDLSLTGDVYVEQDSCRYILDTAVLLVNGKNVICPINLAYDPETDHYYMRIEEHDEISKAFENKLRQHSTQIHQVRRQVTNEMEGSGTVRTVVQPGEATDSSLRRSNSVRRVVFSLYQ